MRHSLRTLSIAPTLLIVLSLTGLQTLHAAPIASTAASAIDAFLARTYTANGPGAAVIVVKDGKTLLRKGYGMADLELGVKVEPDMVFRIGSVTKQFTSAATMLLVEQGRHISVKHLLTHSSGVKSYTDLPSFSANMAKDYSVVELIEVFRSQPLEFQPGEKWAYSNSGYFLLGAILEKAGGMPYEEFLKKNIFQPLGMEHTAYGSEAPIIPGRVRGYQKDSEGWVNAPYVSMTQPYAAGALVSSVDDLAKWDQALTAGRLLGKDSLARIWTPYKLTSGEATGYGYGWGISKFEGHQVFSHGGGINGFSSHVLRMPADGIYVAVLTNFIGGEPNPGYVATKAAALALGIAAVDPVAVQLDQKVLEQYAGIYRIDATTTRTITLEGGRLFSQRTGGARLEIFPKSETEFFFKDSFNKLIFVRGEKGDVARVEMDRGGVKELATRTQEAPPAPRTATTLADPRLLDAYAGKYELAPGFVITITSANGRLMAQATGQGNFEIYPESETRFFYKVVDAQITFTRDKDGNVSQLTLHQNGRDMPAKRIP